MPRSLSALALLVASGCALQVEHDDTTHRIDQVESAQAAPGVTYLWTKRAEEMLRRLDPALVDQPNRKRVLLYGGWTTDGVLSDTWEWDGIGWARRVPPTTPGPRMSAATAFDESLSRTLLFGGIARTAPAMELAEVGLWEWNGSTWARVVTPTTPGPRAGANLVWDQKNHCGYLFGGGTSIERNAVGEFSVASDELWKFDGRDWSQLPKSGAWPPVRTNAAALWDSERGHLIIHGGYGGVGLVQGLVQADTSSFRNDTWEWDGSAWTQWAAGGLDGEQGAPTLAIEPTSGTIRLAAEYPPFVNTLGTVIYRAENQRWVAQANRGLIDVDHESSAPGVVGDSGSLLFSKSTWSSVNQAFLFVSGVKSRSLASPLGAPYEHDWIGNDSGFTRKDSTIQPTALSSSGVATVGANVFVFGGQGVEDAPPSDDFFYWDGGRWAPIKRSNPTPPIRRDPGLAALADGRLVLFGGRAPGGRLDDTWVWRQTGTDPVVGTWTEITTTPKPTGRYGMAMVGLGTTVALFGGGGEGDTILADTWLFDGTKWSQATPATSPPGRRTQSAAVSAENSMWMFGGGTDTTGSSALDDLWDFRLVGSVATWTLLEGPSTTRRRRAGMATDPTFQRTILYGGSGDDARSELYDVTARPAEPHTGIVREDNQDRPRRRYTAAMAPNAAGGLVVFGGTSSDSDSRLADTWQLQQLGASCTDSTQCGYGQSCTEGVCCESSSCGPCNTCAAAGSRGLCAPRGSYGPVPGCDGEGRSCSVDGHCRLADQQRCASDDACASGTCLNGTQGAGVCCTAAGCAVKCVEGTNDLQTPDGTRISCGVYACAADRCASTCNSLSDCAQGAVCNDQKQCVSAEVGVGEDPGCGCRTLRAEPLGKGAFAAVLLVCAVLARRRRSALERQA